MLSRLTIENYALIDKTEIDFDRGFSVITGQTGAGKSILLGALSLLTGARADAKAVTDKDRKTIVEAFFTDSKGEETIIRREINSAGRSRAFIDDSPVTLTLLTETTLRLLDIHSQHANLSLNTPKGQLAIIDAFGDNEDAIAEYKKSYDDFLKARNAIKLLKEENEKNRDMQDLLAYKLEILDKLKPKTGELEAIERRFEMLSEADEIRRHLSAAYALLYGDGSDSALSAIAEASEEMQQTKPELLDPDANTENSISYRLKSAYVELKDIAETIQGFTSEVESDPAALSKTGVRMHAIYDAMKQLKVKDYEELPELHKTLRAQLDALTNADHDLGTLEKEARLKADLLKKTSEELSRRRRESADRFAKLLTEEARPLGLQNLKFEVAVEPKKLASDGADAVEFRCSFNKNGEMMPMATTASGGELSRLTLAIKGIMSEKMDMPTVIFDEIDTGVSGEIASKMGQMMQDMAKRMQVISITHLPQVAALGENHYKVYKQDTDQRTVSSVAHLTQEQRGAEIAAMISGADVTEAAMAAAEALLAGK